MSPTPKPPGPKAAPSKAPRPRRGWAPLGETAQPILRPAFEARGFSQARIASDWAQAVGERLARLCWPMRLDWRGAEEGEGGTLVVGASGGAALEIQHTAPQIIARINAFYGYRAVARLSIDQTSPRLPPRRAAAAPPPPEAPPPGRLDQRLKAVKDPALKEALDRLIRNHAARAPKGAAPSSPDPSSRPKETP